MSLDSNIVSQFAKLTNDKEKTKTESTVYGEIVERNGRSLAMIDGAEEATPINTTTTVKEGERVVITIKNHEAVVTGNQSNPSIGAFELDELGNLIISQCVTFKGLADGTTTIDGNCIKTGTIDAERLNLTGAITWNNLASDTQKEINDAQSAASSAQSTASSAQSIANDAQSLASSAYNLASSNRLPDYIKSTYIDGTQVNSPVIRGGVVGGARFSNLGGTTWIEVGVDQDGSDNDNYGLALFSSTYGANNAYFSIFKGDYGYVTLGTLEHFDFMTLRSSTSEVVPYGTWDFSNATVAGITAQATFA